MASITSYSTARGTLWRVAWREDGVQRTRRGFPTRKAAEAWWSDPEPAAELPDPEHLSMTVGDGYRAWVAENESRWSASTAAVTARLWARTLEPAFGDLPVSELSTVAVERFLDRHAHEHADTTAARVRTILRSAVEVGVTRGVVRTNVVDAAARHTPGRQSERGRTEPVVVTRGQVEALTEAAAACARVREAGVQRAEILRVLAATGIRWGEVVALRPQDVEDDGARLSITRAASEVDGHMVMGEPVRVRTVAVPLWARSALSDALGRALNRQRPLLWETSRGGVHRSPGRGGWWGQALAAARRRDKTIPAELKLSDMRHVAADTMLAAGIPVETVALQLGLRDERAVTETYGDRVLDPLDRVAALR